MDSSTPENFVPVLKAIKLRNSHYETIQTKNHNLNLLEPKPRIDQIVNTNNGINPIFLRLKLTELDVLKERMKSNMQLNNLLKMTSGLLIKLVPTCRFLKKHHKMKKPGKKTFSL